MPIQIDPLFNNFAISSKYVLHFTMIINYVMKKLFQIFFYSVVSMKMQAGKTVVSMCDTMPGDHDRVTLVIIMESVITAMLTVLVTFLMAGAGQEKQC